MSKEAWRKGRKTLPIKLTHELIGTCGHTYKRKDVISSDLRKMPLTPEVWELVDQQMAKMVENSYKEDACHECVANAKLVEARKSIADFATVMQMAPLPHLSGSLKIVSYAETVRSAMWYRHVWKRYNAVRNSFSRATIATELMTHGLRALADKHGIVPESPGPSPDMIAVHDEVQRAASLMGRASADWRFTYEEAVAFWLLMRYEWTTLREFFDEQRPKVWIANKMSQKIRVPEPDPQDASAAIVMAQLAYWIDRQTAEDMYALLRRDKNLGQSVILLMQSNTGSTWREIIDDHYIWDALNRPPRPAVPVGPLTFLI